MISRTRSHRHARSFVGAIRRRILLALCLVAAAPATARERIDVVELTNGDRVTCEIISLYSATLSARTAAFGTVEIDWPDVAALTSSQLFEIELTSGRRIIGRFGKGGAPGDLNVETLDGTSSSVTLAEIVGIVQQGATIWRSHRGHLDVGFDYASAAHDTQFSVDAELALQGRHFRWANSVSANLSDNDTSERRARSVAKSTLEIPISRQWSLLGGSAYEHNDDLDLDARVMVSAVAVWIPRRSARGRWGIGAGGGGAEESYLAGQGSERLASGVVYLFGDYDRFGRYGTQASGELVYLPIFTGPARNRLEIRASLRQKLSRDFTFSVSPYYSFDSRPPQGVEQRESFGLVSAIGWWF